MLNKACAAEPQQDSDFTDRVRRRERRFHYDCKGARQTIKFDVSSCFHFEKLLSLPFTSGYMKSLLIRFY